MMRRANLFKAFGYYSVALVSDACVGQKKGIIMKIFLRTLLAFGIITITCSANAGELNERTPKGAKAVPQPNWSVLTEQPLKSTKAGNKQVDIFPAQTKIGKALDYAWATCASLNDTCAVIIWIRGTKEDTRIIYEGKKENNVCTVYISRDDFDKQFKYCVLSAIKSDTDKGFMASFGGGPSGDRDDYWFEWGDPSLVKPDFYCILK